MIEGQELKATVLVERRVMLIDDDEDIRTVLSEALQDVGYDICCAASGREALTLARAAATARP